MRRLLLEHALPLCMIVALLALLAGAADAQPFRVRVVPANPAAASCRAGTLEATPACEGAPCEKTLRTTWQRAGSEALLSLDPSLPWNVEVSAADCWAAPIRVDAAATNRFATVTVWRTRTISARIQPPDGVPVPKSIAVRFQSAPRTPRQLDPPVAETDIECSVAKGVARCIVPATELDLRLSIPGFIPHYFWSANAADLGELRLARGGSLSGYAVAPQKGAPITVELSPTTYAAFAAPPTSEERIAIRSRTAAVNDRGFFQFTAIEPGSYQIVAKREGLAAARLHEIPVTAGEETTLRAPLLLEPLKRLDVSITPPQDVDGSPWMIILDRRNPDLGSTIVEKSPASAVGTWFREGLENGSYSITVEDRHGAQLGGHAFQSGAGPFPPVSISLPFVFVRGTVTLDGEPVKALLKLTTGMWNERVSLHSDAEGRFSGRVPTEGKYTVEVHRARGNAITLADLQIRRRDDGTATTVELELPKGSLRGQCVDEAGKPVKAWVEVRWASGRATMTTGEDGAFELTGIPPGETHVRAKAQLDETGYFPHVVGRSDSPLTIAIRKHVAIRGRVLSPEGRPVPGAAIRFTSALMWTTRDTISGPDGRYEIRVPAAESVVDLVVVGGGFPAKMTALPVVRGVERDLMLRYDGGRMVIRTDPRRPVAVRRDVGFIDSWSLRRPEALGAPLEIEPGTYTICPQRRLDDRCITKTVDVGSHIVIDAEAWK